MPVSTQMAARVAANIVTSGAVSSRVDRGRHDAWPDSKAIPCARVYLGDTEIEAQTLTSPRTFSNLVEIKVEIYVRETKTAIVDDLLETAIETINDTMEGDRTLNTLADWMDAIPTAVEREYNGTDGARAMGRATLTYQAAYTTAETA